jgi:phosphatidylglycerol:prolipoprotein diacylglycerol transferase
MKIILLEDVMPDIMGQMDIAFPNLNIYLENVPKNFTVFGFTIALYGVIIGLGFFLALILISKVAKATGQNPDTYWDAATYIIIFSIIGARLYYVFFAWDFYKDDPISILYIRNGGLAIYGGVIGGFLTAFIFCKIKKKSFLQLTDTIMPGLLLGQTMGRWGNFTNREAFGEYTDGLLAMRLPVDAVRSGEITELMKAHMSDATNYIQVSPTFLYESLWNLCLLIIVLCYIKHKKFNGEIVLLYFGGYGLGRAWIEGLRTDQLIMHTTGLPASQMLAICLVIFAVVTEVIVRFRLGKKEKA